MTDVIKRAYYLHLMPNAPIPNAPLKTTIKDIEDFWDMMRKYGKNWEAVRTNNFENDTYTLNWDQK